MTIGTTARGRRPSGRGGTFEALVEAAVDCFYEKGYEATSVQEIVDRARVTKGAFYHHFAAKEDLLLLIHDAFIDHQLALLRDATQSAGQSPRVVLAQLIEELVVGAETHQQHQTIFFEQRRFLSGERFAKVKKKRDEFEQRLVDIIEAGVADGLFREVPSARVLAFGIIGMGAWAYQWYHRGGPMSAREIGRMYADTVLRGLLHPAES